MRLALLAALLAAPAAAQVAPTVDCTAPDLAAPEVAFCASAALEEADAELDQTYRLALVRAQAFDEETAAQGLEVPLGAEEALRRSQEAWTAFREATCDAETALMRGAASVPQTGTICRATHAVARTEDLRAYAPDL